MGDLQQEHLRYIALALKSGFRHRAMLSLLAASGLITFAFAARGVAPQRPLVLSNVRSCRAVLRQEGRVTTLDLTSVAGITQTIPLTHIGKYVQGLAAAYKTALIAEELHHFLIFTDTFASNPGNIQGECGASPSGERYLHVVSLEYPLHETLSVIVDSCWLDLDSRLGNPAYNHVTRTLTIHFAPDHGDASRSYHIEPDGSVIPVAR
jgi:hypothetical protein